MSHEVVARRYARAVFELGQESKSLSQVASNLEAFAAIYSGHAELRDTLANPRVVESDLLAIVAQLCQRLALTDLATRVIRMLAMRRRLRIVPELAAEVRRLTEEAEGTVRAHVTSASPLSDSYLAKLRAELEKATGRKVALQVSTDPSLLAGVVTRIGDRVIDGSARSRLRALGDSLRT